MNVNPQELTRLASAAETPRVDLYGGIHKALRALMSDTLLAVGRMDVADDLDLAQVTQRVLELLDFCRLHLDKENKFLHTAIEARAPGASSAIGHEHEQHVRHIAHVAGTVGVLRASAVAQKPAMATVLYRELALFIAENFQHMHVEETAHNAVLWARYTDAELAAIHDAIIASIPPDVMLFAARWLVPFMNPQERLKMMADMQAKAPPQAFDAVVATVRPHLSQREWEKLANALGIA
ncbi:MAG: hemerythrin domain-containing protein [Burkholderiales bacterium]|nr:hemerythrin domain-containing protein [Burkholderiales bacterium]